MTNATTRAVTINIPNSIRLTPDKREELNFDLTKLPESVIGDIFVGGFRVIMTNTYNAGGKDTPEADRRNNAFRRFTAWLRGEYALTNTGPRESIIGEMRDAFVTKQVTLGKTQKEAEAVIRDTVTKVFGKDEKATFSRFLDAVATMKAKLEGAAEYDVIRQELEASAMEAVEAQRAAKLAAAKDEPELDLSDLF